MKIENCYCQKRIGRPVSILVKQQMGLPDDVRTINDGEHILTIQLQNPEDVDCIVLKKVKCAQNAFTKFVTLPCALIFVFENFTNNKIKIASQVKYSDSWETWGITIKSTPIFLPILCVHSSLTYHRCIYILVYNSFFSLYYNSSKNYFFIINHHYQRLIFGFNS